MSAFVRGARRIPTEQTLVWTVAAVFVVAWSILNGRDLNWDFLNYHLYAAFASLNDRLNQDYFPSNVQSYLLGYVYVPMYMAIRAGWATWQVQALLGLMSLPAIAASWYLARRILPGEGATTTAWRWAMVVAALSSPLFLMEVGTSFVDGATAGLVLASLVLALPVKGVSWRIAAMSGCLAGVACALKMTNSAMVAGIGVVWLLTGAGGWRQALGHTIAFGATAAAAFLVVYGHWGWMLFERFGNPFFPLLLGEVFPSGEYPHESLVLDRFRPLGFWEFLLRPVFMLDPVANVYTEARAPDTRYLALLLLFVGYAVQRALRHLDRNRALEALIAWCGVTWILWLGTSGNGRYGVALALGAGVASLGIAHQLWHARSAHIFAIKSFCLALLALQVLSMSMTVFRWDGRQDDAARYFAPEPDAILVERPHVIVNLRYQSISWLAPFVHPDSSLVSPAGQYTLNPNTKAGAHFRKLLMSGRPILVAYNLTATSRWPVESQLLPERLSPYQKLYGLDVIPGNCHKVVMDRTMIEDFGQLEIERDAENVLMLCPVTYKEALSTASAREFSRHDEVFNKVEKACRHLFRPAGTQTMCNDNFCARLYVNSDTNLHVFQDGGLVALGFNGIQPALVGTRDGILAGEAPKCPSRLGRYVPFTAGGSAFSRPQ